jgi:hypothetical protein
LWLPLSSDRFLGGLNIILREQVVSIFFIFETRKKATCAHNIHPKKSKTFFVLRYFWFNLRAWSFLFLLRRLRLFLAERRKERIYAQSKRPGYGSREIHVYKQKENMG